VDANLLTIDFYWLTGLFSRARHRSRGLRHTLYMMWSRDNANGREARITPLR